MGKAHPDKANYATHSPAFTIAPSCSSSRPACRVVAITYKSTRMLMSVIASRPCSASRRPADVPMCRAAGARGRGHRRGAFVGLPACRAWRSRLSRCRRLSLDGVFALAATARRSSPSSRRHCSRPSRIRREQQAQGMAVNSRRAQAGEEFRHMTSRHREFSAGQGRQPVRSRMNPAATRRMTKNDWAHGRAC